MYSFGADGTSGVNGEVPGNFKVGRELGGSPAYENGPLAIAVVYEELNGNTAATDQNKARKAAVSCSTSSDRSSRTWAIATPAS